MATDLISVFSAIMILTMVYYAYAKNSDSAKKYVVVVIAGIFLTSGISSFAIVMDKWVPMDIWDNILGVVWIVVEIIIMVLLFILILNHYKRSDKILYVAMVLYFVLQISQWFFIF